MSVQSLATAGRPNLSRLVEATLDAWPDHGQFMEIRFAGAADPTLPVAERIATLILAVAGDRLGEYCAGYRWMCETFVEEDLHFRRTGRYRRTTFAEAYEEVYSNRTYMDRYLKGILLSQVLWTNQVRAFDFYLHRFLGHLTPGSDYLEVGPGHGLLLHFAASHRDIASITGWDISESSLAATRNMLEIFGISRPIVLERQDIHESPAGEATFDAVTISEVLEHLEAPQTALVNLRKVLRPGGHLFVNMPVNSPAPDHIYQLSAPEEVEDLVVGAGFRIVDREAVAATGYDLERAHRRKVTINALIVAVAE